MKTETLKKANLINKRIEAIEKPLSVFLNEYGIDFIQFRGKNKDNHDSYVQINKAFKLNEKYSDAIQLSEKATEAVKILYQTFTQQMQKIIESELEHLQDEFENLQDEQEIAFEDLED